MFAAFPLMVSVDDAVSAENNAVPLKVGEELKTDKPDPVSSVRTIANLAEVSNAEVDAKYCASVEVETDNTPALLIRAVPVKSVNVSLFKPKLVAVAFVKVAPKATMVESNVAAPVTRNVPLRSSLKLGVLSLIPILPLLSTSRISPSPPAVADIPRYPFPFAPAISKV